MSKIKQYIDNLMSSGIDPFVEIFYDDYFDYLKDRLSSTDQSTNISSTTK